MQNQTEPATAAWRVTAAKDHLANPKLPLAETLALILFEIEAIADENEEGTDGTIARIWEILQAAAPTFTQTIAQSQIASACIGLEPDASISIPALGD